MINKKKPLDLKDPRVVELLSKKTPAEYIDACVNSKLSSGDKMKITPIWLKMTGFVIEDVQYARNRHPYWKEKKMKNSLERNKARIEKYNYSDGSRKRWGEEELDVFLDLNNDHTDRDLAKYFGRTIPSIQYVRRRISLAHRIFKMNGIKKVHKSSLLKKILKDEKLLREEALGLENGYKENTKITKKTKKTKRKK